MDVVGFSESAPPLYYVLAWLWAQVVGHRRVRAALALGARRGRDGAGRLPARRRAARPPRRARWRRRWSPSTRCWSGTRRRPGATRCWSCSARSRCSTSCARSAGGRARGLGWGVASALALATHYFAIFPIALEALLLLRRRGRAAAVGARDRPRDRRRSWRRWRSTRRSQGHAEWIGDLQPRPPALGGGGRPSSSARRAT